MLIVVFCPRSDVVITTLFVLTEAIFQKNYYFARWMEKISSKFWTIFDETNCVKKVKNYHQLKKK